MRAKWITRLLIGAGLLAAAQGAAAGQITGSAHDFSARGWGSGEICIFCHAPHNNANVAGDVLWNHALSTATYTLYSSPSMNATVPVPGGVSKLCLSCHDGTVAIDSWGARTGTVFVTGGKNLGTNLSNDHPIGILYDAALVTADGTLRPTTTAVTIGSGAQTKSGTIASVLLSASKVECSSCHDVHNTFTSGGDLLKIANTASGLCLTCHGK